LTLQNYQHYIAENPDACISAAEIYDCGMDNQMVLTYNMTEVGEGNLTKVYTTNIKSSIDFSYNF
jgi:hypothetical protein